MNKVTKESEELCRALIKKNYSFGEMISILEVAKSVLFGIAIKDEIEEHIAEYHAPDEIGGTDEGLEGSGSDPEAVNEPES